MLVQFNYHNLDYTNIALVCALANKYAQERLFDKKDRKMV